MFQYSPDSQVKEIVSTFTQLVTVDLQTKTLYTLNCNPKLLQSTILENIRGFSITNPLPTMDTAEAREMRQHIDALEVVELIQLMDHACLNIRGSIGDLRNRHLRAEVRHIFCPGKPKQLPQIQYPLAEDENDPGQFL